jgi:hypothetical protein
MKFLMLYTPAKKTAAPTAEAFAAMGAFIEKSLKDGVLIWTEGLAPGSQGARVERTSGEFTVKDGPFAEAKEVIGGFALINAKSMQEAIGHAREFLGVAGDGVTEIHRVAEASDFDQAAFTPEEQAREAKWREQMQAQAGK